MTTRRNKRYREPSIPPELESFDRWLYADNGIPTGLIDYFSEVESAELPISMVLPVSEWYRIMLSRV